MKYLFPLLIVLPLGLFAQLRVQLSGDFSLNFLPTTATGRADATNSAANDRQGIVLGAELWFPGRKEQYKHGLFARYGRVFSTRLQASFSGPAAGSTADSERTVFAQTNLLRFGYSQLGAMTKVALFSSPRLDWSLQLGGGVSLIHQQWYHTAASEFHQGEARLQLPSVGYEIDQNGIRESASFVNSVSLLEDMLVKVTPFAEVGVSASSKGGVTIFLMTQIGLRPIVNPDLYAGDDLEGRSWFQLRTGAKGRLF